MNDQELRDLGEDIEAREATTDREMEPAHAVRSRRAPRDPSEVYSLRIPVTRLAEVRRIAASERTTSAALLRRWVLERLDAEGQGDEDEEQAKAVTDALRRAISMIEHRRAS